MSVIESVSNLESVRQALDFAEQNDLTTIGTNGVQVTHCHTTVQVDQLLALGFKPHRYEYEGHKPGSGILVLRFGSSELYSGCVDDLLDYAESRTSAE